jgi:hypothetical protein
VLPVCSHSGILFCAVVASATPPRLQIVQHVCWTLIVLLPWRVTGGDHSQLHGSFCCLLHVATPAARCLRTCGLKFQKCFMACSCVTFLKALLLPAAVTRCWRSGPSHCPSPSRQHPPSQQSQKRRQCLTSTHGLPDSRECPPQSACLCQMLYCSLKLFSRRVTSAGAFRPYC